MMADWMHIVTCHDAYSHLSGCVQKVRKILHIVTSQDAYKSLKLINLKFESCHMMADWMHIVTGQDAYKIFKNIA
jgi:hypothetical protein